jgi:hypothetical protein
MPEYPHGGGARLEPPARKHVYLLLDHLPSDVHEPVRPEPELGLEPVRFVEGWARGVRARGAGSSLGWSFIIKKIIKKDY